MNNLIGFDIQLSQLLNNYKFKKLNNSIIFHGSKGIGKRNFVNNLIIKLFQNDLNNNDINHNLNLFYNNSHPNIKVIEKELTVSGFLND